MTSWKKTSFGSVRNRVDRSFLGEGIRGRAGRGHRGDEMHFVVFRREGGDERTRERVYVGGKEGGSRDAHVGRERERE